MSDPTRQTLEHFQTTPLPQLEDEIKRGQQSEGLRELFGDQLAAEIEQMVQTPDGQVLSAERPLVVLLPGITGSTLLSNQGNVGLIWLGLPALIAGHFPMLEVAADGGDTGAVNIVAGEPIALFYLPLQLHLKYLGGCDVLTFPFDWRQTPDRVAEQLRGLLNRLNDPHGRRVHLVGHSMGGLVARCYCLRYPHEAQRLVEQVVMLGTPNYGSAEAVRNLISGGETLLLAQKLNRNNRALQVARTFPSIYAMLPAPADCYPDDAPLPYPFATDGLDPYDVVGYQIDGVSQAMMQRADAFYHSLAGQTLPVPGQVIAGYDLPTRVGVRKGAQDDLLHFDFESLMSNLGDGTVPLGSVVGIPDVNRYYLPKGKHSDLPLYGSVRRAVRDLVHGKTPDLPTSYHAGAVLGDEIDPTLHAVPEAPLPGSLSQAQLDAIAERIRLGQATPEDLSALAKFA
ncbi:MAG: hypothetical protein OHK0022_48570 [Roseiflexaceae bacterium]